MFIFFFSSRRRPTRSDRDWSSDVCSSDLSSSTGTPRLMLAGHIDEIGLQITHVDDEVYLYFAGIGGEDGRGAVRGRRENFGGGVSFKKIKKKRDVASCGRKPKHRYRLRRA